MKLLVSKSEANFADYTETRKYYPSPGGAMVHVPNPKKVNKVGKIGSFLGKNKGKVGLALGGLAVAGGIASKALSKPQSLESRLKKTLKKNPKLNQAANMASKMFR